MSVDRTFKLDNTPFAGLDRLSGHLRYHSRRQQVIAANLANLDTPGYRSRDLVFQETFSAQFKDGDLSRRMSHGEELVVNDDETPDQDGNSVSLEHQMARTTANTIRYQALSEVLNRKLKLLKYAANDGR